MKSKLLIAGFIAIATTAMLKATPNPQLNYHVDRFADIEVLRYDVPGFDNLSLQQKKLVYYLTQAALQGRDILTDQNCRYNLAVRQTLEAIYTNFKGNRTSADYKGFELYLKQVWFANGIHHHYGNDKFVPTFSQKWFDEQVRALGAERLPLAKGETVEQFLATMDKVIFDPAYMAKKVNLGEGQDLVLTSAVNFYDGVTQKEVEDYYASIKKPNDPTPISYGLNTKVVKRDGKVVELPYKVGGIYSDAILNILYWLTKASEVAENDQQASTIKRLMQYYASGDLKVFDQYSITWARDTQSTVDFINGFIEDYNDPLGMKGSWESIVNFKNQEASHRTEVISQNAQWFEDHSPIDNRFRKAEVKGVSAKVITACILAGDSYPSTPIGINLPNADWIRAAHGSKSVTLENITEAYDIASHGNGFNEEFVIDQPTRDLLEKYLFITDNMHTDLHECLGHASGQLLPGVDVSVMKSYGACLEETRADLFALYYLADPKLLELGLLDNPDAYKAEYYKYMLNGLMTQLMRIELGKDLEEAHMRNRQLIAAWCLDHGKADNVVELIKRDGKTFVQINDYQKLRGLFGTLLAEIQRIKSEGDYNACAALIEKYAVKIDPVLHKEVLDRYAKLDIAPYKGFVNPTYVPVTDAAGEIIDVKITNNEGYAEQMLRYSRDYSPLTHPLGK